MTERHVRETGAPDVRVREISAAPGWLVRAIVGAAVFLLVAGTSLLTLQRFVEIAPPVNRLVRYVAVLLYVDAENNVAAWFASMVLAGLGAAFVVLSRLNKQAGRAHGGILGLSAVAFALAIDESAQIHERFASLSSAVGLELAQTDDWIIIGIPLAVVVGAFCVWAARAVSSWLRVRLIVAGLVYLLGAVGFEALGGYVKSIADIAVSDSAFLAYQAVMTLEEGLEFAGAILALLVTLSTIRAADTAEGRLVWAAAPTTARV